MTTRMLTIGWDLIATEPPRVAYSVDDAPVGEDDEGFDRILDLLRADEDLGVTLRVQQLSEFGGESLTDSLPFVARIDELRSTLGDRKVVYEIR